MSEYSYKDSGIQWLGEIPTHWKPMKLKKLIKLIPSNVDKRSEDDETPVKLCNYVDVYYNDVIDLSIEFMSATANDTELKRFQLIESDVIITKDSEDPHDIAVPAYVKETEDKLLCGYHLSILRNNSHELNNQFLFWALKDEKIASQLHREATGITRWAIGSKHIKNSTIALPPTKEQIAIADYLEKACAKIDRVIEMKRRQIEKIIEHRKNRINEVVRFGIKDTTKIQITDLDYLPHIKEGWGIDRFKDVASLRNTKTDDKSDAEDYLELEDIDQGSGRILNRRNTLDVASSVTKFFEGDVLFGKLRPYLEKYYLAEFDGKCTGEILAFQPRRISGAYLKYLVGSKWFISLCNSMSYGAKMPRVNWNTQLSQIYLPLPKPEEQEDIVKYLDQISSKSHSSIKNLSRQIDVLSSYKISLIHECITGKKKVFEGEPESLKAEAL